MPQEWSVNSGIRKTSLKDAPFKLRLPNPVTLAQKILKYGKGCLLYKADLIRAYRQFRTNPPDWPLFLLHWEDQFFLDISIPFSVRRGSSACQRTTEAISAIAKEEVGADTAPYINDTVGAAVLDPAHLHYQHFLDSWSLLGKLFQATKWCQGLHLQAPRRPRHEHAGTITSPHPHPISQGRSFVGSFCSWVSSRESHSSSHPQPSMSSTSTLK